MDPDFHPAPAAAACHWLDRFRQHAARHPDRPAVICGQAVTRYGDLDRQSDAIAAELLRRGIGPGAFVGVGLDRSPELPATLLGAAKAGAAYLPLDPAYPAARLARMVAAADIRALLTTSELAARFPGVEIIDLWQIPAGHAPPATPADGTAIYAIFTSGSTGEPKAAGVLHRGFRNLLAWYESELALTADDTVLVISSPSFDLTQKNLFAPLAAGATLVLDSAANYDIRRISELVRDHRASVLNCTPSAFYPIVEAAAADGFAALASLRHVVLGGEPIALPRLRAWLTHPSCQAEVLNTYGPTECTDICLFHRLHRGNLDDHPFVPLGRAIPGVHVTLRGETGGVPPDGAPGELCISGAGLGSGYRNDPARTAAAFAGGFYRTGDLAVRHPDGLFEFRGRADHQVKVNGHRIELGEIELALQAHPAVQEAVVTATAGRLTAHFRGTATAAELRRFLADSLPAAMIPGDFQQLASFPLTPNGKVDRRALATVEPAPPVLAVGGSLEARILAIWSELLGRPVHDATANFFDLGGNSLHLAVLHVRLLEMSGLDFPITRLFSLPTARAIAAFLSPAPAAAPAKSPAERARLARTAFHQFRRPAAR